MGKAAAGQGSDAKISACSSLLALAAPLPVESSQGRLSMMARASRPGSASVRGDSQLHSDSVWGKLTASASPVFPRNPDARDAPLNTDVQTDFPGSQPPPTPACETW